MIKDLIKVDRDSTQLSYVLEDDQLFYEVGYKVLHGQENEALVKCFKVTHNGKIKLIYNISNYQTLQSVMTKITAEDFLATLQKLLAVIIDVKNNGFLTCENIDMSLENIFLEKNNFDPCFIYLPINGSIYNHPTNFEETMRMEILQAISAHNLNTKAIMDFSSDLKAGIPLEDIENSLKSLNLKSFGTKFDFNKVKKIKVETLDNKKQIPKAKATQSSDRDINHENKKLKKFGLSNVFSPKKNTSVQAFKPTLSLIGINTPIEVEFSIDKMDYVIGSSPKTADGNIDFNKAISRSHCKIVYKDKNYYIVDMDSSNGTYLNNVKIHKDQQVMITDGDRIKLANSEFIVESILKDR
ncbi:MAG: hypothetical protein CVU95_15845 [Firmicutes bacterium HGW-Firmicutes-2]|nr:MAG: hypothetical protein CVU95_15845 [Firmicutes bacterium HGW-Firmicutes-2]